MKKVILIAVVFLACGISHAQCGVLVTSAGAFTGVGAWSCGLGVVVAGLENSYCTKGSAPEMTEGTPLWGATDDLATLPTKCMYTGLDATPSPGNIYTPATGPTLEAIFASANGGAAVNSDGTTSGSPAMHYTCGDVITLTIGATYTGSTGSPPQLVAPAMACDGSHWNTIKSSGVSNALFPGEGVRATPCVIGLTNDDTHSSGVRQLPGYPDFSCPTPTALTAKIQQPSNSLSAAITFASGANHYRFIGIEFAKNPTVSVDQIVKLAADGLTLGTHHIIVDRSILHGDQWTSATTATGESQQAMNGKNSQYVALINSWDYDTYCNANCIDSHAFGAGTGLYQDGPFKLYNNLMASSGETWLFGGGGQGPGTPNTANVEIRSNHSFKPLTWIIPINTCPTLFAVIPKNLGEFKNMTFALLEGNVYENSFQGCQSDQVGYSQLLNPSSQNNHATMTVTYNGTNVVTTSSSFTHHTSSSPISGNPVDAANCPPGGCILEDTVSNINYRFCNGSNGCDQSGIPNLQCGTTTPAGSVAGNACTNDGQCPGSYCAPTTSARITCGLTGQPACPAAASSPGANGCVPGDCPTCKNKNITFRFNEVYNTTNGLQINTGLSSHCRDQGAGMSNVSIHDNELHGLSRDMSNGNDPYSGSTAFSLSNNSLPPSVVSFLGIRHNTIATEEGNQNGVSGFGNQSDRSDIQYLEGIAITDNIAPGSWGISKGSGSNVTKGILGKAGLANTYAVNSCQRYFTAEVPSGTVSTPTQNFTFAGLPIGGSNYLVSLNGQYTAITNQQPTSFTVTATVKVDDTIVVRDLNDCNWTFSSNIVGLGVSGLTGISEFGSPGLSPNFASSGQDQSPYPNPNTCGAGNTNNCILDESALQGSFTNNFVSWLTGRNGNYAIANGSPFLNTASDALSRPATGKSPGADFTLLAAKLAGVRTATNIPALSITTTTLPGGTQGIAYNAQLVASFGASQYWNGYKSWWLEGITTACTPSVLTPACGSLNNGTAHSGIVISRSGAVNGPLAILTVSRTGCPSACVSNYGVSQTITGGAWEVGQVASLSQFVDAGGNGQGQLDSQFNGICTITVASSNTFSCRQSGDIAGTNLNRNAHAPNAPTGSPLCGVNPNSKCDALVAFAPVAPGTYTFWVGVRDGAFQVARKQISIVIAPGVAPVTVRPTSVTVLSNGSGTSNLNLGFDGNTSTFGTADFSEVTLIFYDLIYKGFPAVSGTPTSVTLTVLSDVNAGANVPVANAQYSLDGGSSWIVLYSGSHGLPANPISDTVSLPSSQNLTKVQVRFQASDCSPSPRCTVHGEFYESWITVNP